MFHVEPGITQWVLKIIRFPNPARVLSLGVSADDTIYRVSAIPAPPTKIRATGPAQSGLHSGQRRRCYPWRAGHGWARVGDDVLGARILGEWAAEG